SATQGRCLKSATAPCDVLEDRRGKRNARGEFESTFPIIPLTTGRAAESGPALRYRSETLKFRRKSPSEPLVSVPHLHHIARIADCQCHPVSSSPKSWQVGSAKWVPQAGP